MTARLAALIHHIVTLFEPHELGATKLAKILWYSDVEYYRRTGETVTHCDDYRKQSQGPLHRNFYEALDRLKSEGLVAESSSLTPVGSRREFFSLALPDLSCFNAEEIATVDRVISRIKPMSAKRISDETHDALWDEARWNERIPVAAGAVIPGDSSAELLAWATSELEKDEYSTTT